MRWLTGMPLFHAGYGHGARDVAGCRCRTSTSPSTSTFWRLGPRRLPEAAESRVRCLFDGGERRLAHHRSHTPQAASPATQPPAYPLEPLTPALPPLSTPPVCSWQANFARSTLSLATILESIVAYSTRCARWCARFLRPTRPRGTPAAAALLPAAGLPDHVFLSELRVGYRVSRVSRTVHRGAD